VENILGRVMIDFLIGYALGVITAFVFVYIWLRLAAGEEDNEFNRW